MHLHLTKLGSSTSLSISIRKRYELLAASLVRRIFFGADEDDDDVSSFQFVRLIRQPKKEKEERDDLAEQKRAIVVGLKN